MLLLFPSEYIQMFPIKMLYLLNRGNQLREISYFKIVVVAICCYGNKDI
jgi:hypothetical protein